MTIELPARSFVIPVLDFSPHSAYNILTLLEDLHEVEGEVICIFNTAEVFEKLRSHARIDKFCFNNLNAGVSRSWNMGINLAEGRAVFIMNADLNLLSKIIAGSIYYGCKTYIMMKIYPWTFLYNIPFIQTQSSIRRIIHFRYPLN